MQEVVPDWTLGWRLQRSLAHSQVSVEGMAAELGVSRSTISRWLNDHGAEPRLGYLKLWAMRTGVPFSWLAEGVSSAPKMGARSRNLRISTPLQVAA